MHVDTGKRAWLKGAIACSLPATVHAQGFKEYVQTRIPITAGGIVRIKGRLEIGALSESVTVTPEATVLKTDKADVSVSLARAPRTVQLGTRLVF